jgi:hypothetical protein
MRGAGLWAGIVWMCLCGGLLGGCEQPVTTVEVEREETAGTLGFALAAYPVQEDRIALSIQCAEFPYPLPVVSLNDSTLAMQLHTRSGLRWETFVAYGDSITYRIEWQSDALTGRFAIPSRIDSLFCNGHAVPRRAPNMPYDTMNVDSIFHFRWSEQNTSYYHISIRYELADSLGSRYVDTVTSYNRLSVTTVRDSGEIAGMYFAVAGLVDSVGAVAEGGPTVTSGRLHLYRDVVGGSYYTKIWRAGY